MSRMAPAGLVLRERRYAMAHLSVRRDVATLAAQLSHAYGVTLPQGSSLRDAGGLRLLGISPGRWLALRAEPDDDFCADLAALLRGAAAVCDLSDAYTVFELRGPAVRAGLSKLLALDLHDRSFAVGGVAATVAAHMPVMLWRLPDEDGAVFELAVSRSYEQSLREVLVEAGAASGADSPP